MTSKVQKRQLVVLSWQGSAVCGELHIPSKVLVAFFPANTSAEKAGKAGV